LEQGSGLKIKYIRNDKYAIGKCLGNNESMTMDDDIMKRAIMEK
jgi:hypothetical protein